MPTVLRTGSCSCRIGRSFELSKGRPQFTVNMAMMHNRRPILGVVHAPVLGLTYLAATERARGANRERIPRPRYAQGRPIPID